MTTQNDFSDPDLERYEEIRRVVGKYLQSPAFKESMRQYDEILESLTAKEIIFLETPEGQRLKNSFAVAHGHEPETVEETQNLLQNAREQGFLRAAPSP